MFLSRGAWHGTNINVESEMARFACWWTLVSRILPPTPVVMVQAVSAATQVTGKLNGAVISAFAVISQFALELLNMRLGGSR